MLPVVDLSRRGARFADRFGAVAERIARSGAILLGEELTAFEHELASWVGARDSVAVASGAAAIQLALTACGIGDGDEVIVPAFTAVPTVSAVLAAGARPRVIDVDPATACLTPDAIADARTAATRAALPVHLYGYPAPLPDATDLVVVEDAAQALGAWRTARPSHAVAYSFYPTKNLGGIGDGATVATDRPDVAARVRRDRVHGMTAQYVHESISQNFRMSELEAAWLRIGLEQLEADVAARRRIVGHYRERAPHLRWQAAHAEHAYHLCVFRSSDRDADRARLAAAGVTTAVHYPVAITRQPAYLDLTAGAHCPHAEAWADECVTVPCFPEMSDAEVELVADALAELPGDHPGDFT